jgi:hypothetical protein
MLSPAAALRDRRSPILGLLGRKGHHHGHHFGGQYGVGCGYCGGGGHYGGGGLSGSSAQASNIIERCFGCDVYVIHTTIRVSSLPLPSGHFPLQTCVPVCILYCLYFRFGHSSQDRSRNSLNSKLVP